VDYQFLQALQLNHRLSHINPTWDHAVGLATFLDGASFEKTFSSHICSLFGIQIAHHSMNHALTFNGKSQLYVIVFRAAWNCN
jgi:hypothetical protein